MSYSWIPKVFAKSVQKNLGHPTRSPLGLMIAHILSKRNRKMTISAVELLGIEGHHRVLEVGFGPGHGLKESFKFVDSGEVYGIDVSTKMIQDASKLVSSEIKTGRLKILNHSVDKTEFHDNLFDRIFHVNCFYFWPSILNGAMEMNRILKPGGLMLAALNLNGLKEPISKGFLTTTQTSPDRYQKALINSGFVDVEMKTVSTEWGSFQAIYAYKPSLKD